MYKVFAVGCFNLVYIEMKCPYTIAESILITSLSLMFSLNERDREREIERDRVVQ